MPETERNPLNDELLQEIRTTAWEERTATEILSWAIENFHPRLALSASFGGPEGMVLVDLMHRLEPGSRVFVLDTGRLPQATYDLIDRVRDRYDKPVEVVLPDTEAVQKMVRDRGVNLFYESLENRQLCCRIRKVEPLERYLQDVDAYVSGLRRGQSSGRSDTPKVHIDHARGGAVKVNPLADWSHNQVWDYVRAHKVPVNRLHGKGYPSVGCEPCSRAIGPGEDARAGRWWWENEASKECGLHVDENAGGSGI